MAASTAEKENNADTSDSGEERSQGLVLTMGRSLTELVDADGDGDVGLHDALLVSQWMWRTVELLFDITVCVAPVGAIVGTALSVIGGVIVARAFVQLSVEVEPWVDKFSSIFNGFPEAKTYVEIALAVIVAVDALTVLHGFADGLRRAKRKVTEFGEDGGAFGCCDNSKIKPIEAAPAKSCAWHLACFGPLLIKWFAGHVFQAAWAIGGTVVIWISIIVSYVASVLAIFLFGSFYVAVSYCDNVAEVIDMGVEIGESSLQRAAETIDLVEEATASGSAAEASVYGDDNSADGGALAQCADSILGNVCSTVETRASATAALLYETSPFPELLAFLDTQLPVACSTVELGEQLVLQADSFGDFLEEFKDVAEPVPHLMKQAMVGTWLMLVGQILVLVFHQKYFTLWYYEGSMAKRNAEAKKRLAAEAEADPTAS